MKKIHSHHIDDCTLSEAHAIDGGRVLNPLECTTMIDLKAITCTALLALTPVVAIADGVEVMSTQSAAAAPAAGAGAGAVGAGAAVGTLTTAAIVGAVAVAGVVAAAASGGDSAPESTSITPSTN